MDQDLNGIIDLLHSSKDIGVNIIEVELVFFDLGYFGQLTCQLLRLIRVEVLSRNYKGRLGTRCRNLDVDLIRYVHFVQMSITKFE